MIKEEDLTYIGKFGKTHGYKGEINLGFDQFADDAYLEEGMPLIVKNGGCYVPFYTVDYRSRGRDMSWLVTIEGIGERPMGMAQVAMLEHLDVYGLKDQVLEIYPDFLTEQELSLEGYELVDETFGRVGCISHLDDTTENLLLEVTTADGRDVILPFNLDFVVSQDEGKQELTVNYPEGILTTLLDPDFQGGREEDDE